MGADMRPRKLERPPTSKHERFWEKMLAESCVMDRRRLGCHAGTRIIILFAQRESRSSAPNVGRAPLHDPVGHNART